MILNKSSVDRGAFHAVVRAGNLFSCSMRSLLSPVSHSATGGC